LDTIKNNWSAALTISKVLLTIMQLLTDPNPSDPLVKPIAQEMLNAPEQFFKTAQEWTKKYASPDLMKSKE
jgi:ubiquitin-conjugating enzyme E2 D/E